MRTSIDKVHAALDQAEALGDREDVEPRVQMVSALLAMGRGHLTPMLPTDPEELDELLARGAVWLLDLRSDDAAAIAMHELPAGVPDE